MLTPQPVPFGRYELIHRLGQGRMGEVHLARLRGAAGFEKLYVLKTLVPQPGSDPELPQRFQHEARLLVSLQHPNIAQVYELGETDGTPFMAVEYVPGVELAQVLARARQLGAAVPIPIALHLAQRVAEALGYAHRKVGEDGRPLDIIHRAISPHTVRVSFDGEVKVLDFSLARSTAALAHTGPAKVMGRLGYMSPEQARAEKVDARSDIYSCGVVLWELLAGRRLIDDGPVGQMLAAMIHPVIPALHLLRPDISQSLEAVLLYALAPSASDRYASAEELARALGEERAREGRRVGDEEVRAWVRALCPQELADQQQLISTLGSGTTITIRVGSESASSGGGPTRVLPRPTASVPAEARPGQRAAAARRDPAPMMAMGVVCLLLAGAVGPLISSEGCGGDEERKDAGVLDAEDAGEDGGVDAGDAGEDGGADAGDDGGVDAGEDGGADAGEDGGVDAGADGGVDAGVVTGAVPGAGGPAQLCRKVQVYPVTERKGQYTLWAGRAHGLGMRSPVTLVAPAERNGCRTVYGTAVVEALVAGNRARVRPDAPPPKGVYLLAFFTPEPPRTDPGSPPPPPSPETPLEAWGKLRGVAPHQKLTLLNQGQRAWTQCMLRLPDKQYRVERMAGGEQQDLPLARFDPASPRPDLQVGPAGLPVIWAELRCAEGFTRLRLTGN